MVSRIGRIVSRRLRDETKALAAGPRADQRAVLAHDIAEQARATEHRLGRDAARDDRTALRAALKPLERRGLLVVNPDPKDRRGRLLTLASEGRSLLGSAVPAWERTHKNVDGLLGGSDPNQLRNDLRSLS